MASKRALSTDPDAGLATIIERTAELMEQKQAIYDEIAVARTAARSLVAMRVGNQSQHDWVSEYLPIKKKGVVTTRNTNDTPAPAPAVA